MSFQIKYQRRQMSGLGGDSEGLTGGVYPVMQ